MKGVHFLVKWFCRLLEECPDLHQELHIHGPFVSDSYFQQVSQLVGQKFKGRVFLHNKEISPSEREVIMRDLDLLVYTSAMDGLPYCFLEAMSHGTPVVSSNVGGIEHVVVHDFNGRIMRFRGLYLEALDAESPYNKLLSIMAENEEEYYAEFKVVLGGLLSSRSEIQRLSKNAIRTIADRFTIAHMNFGLRRIVAEG